MASIDPSQEPPLPVTDRDAMRAWVQAQQRWEDVDLIIEHTDSRAHEILTRHGDAACLPWHVVDRLLGRDQHLAPTLAANEHLDEEVRTHLARRALKHLGPRGNPELAEQTLRSLLGVTDGRLPEGIADELSDFHVSREDALDRSSEPGRRKRRKQSSEVAERILLTATEGVEEDHLLAMIDEGQERVRPVLDAVAHPAAGPRLFRFVSRCWSWRTLQHALLQREEALAIDSVRTRLRMSPHGSVLEELLQHETSGFRFREVFHRLAEVRPQLAALYVRDGRAGAIEHLEVEDLMGLLQHDRSSVRSAALLATERLERAEGVEPPVSDPPSGPRR